MVVAANYNSHVEHGTMMELSTDSMPQEHQHLLLELAKTYPVSTRDLAPSGCKYDLLHGGWVSEHDSSLLASMPGRPKLKTKKFDIETGEDQKGE